MSRRTLESSQKSLKEYAHATSQNPQDLFNRLFFAGRNGAISALLRNIEHHFQKESFWITANWQESSFGHPRIEVILHDKKTGDHFRNLNLERHTVGAPNSQSYSNCIYSLKHIENSAYYPRTKPVVAQKFDALLGDPAFFEKMEQGVLGINYPFNYTSYSSF